MPSHRPTFTARELTVMILAGLILVLVPMGWGGVVLWTVCAALGLATAAFLAVVSETRTQRVWCAVWLVGLIVALVAATLSGHEVLSYRWLDHVCFPAAALLGSALAYFLLSRDLISRPAAEARRELVRSVPFWAGVVLFSYFALQDFNAWGIVVDREAFWLAQGMPGVDVGQFDVRLQPYVRWLPSGLNAPFSAAATSQAPMNAWRMMMVLGAPWLLLLALRHGLQRRRAYVVLAWISVLAACGYGVFGFLNQLSYGTILGYPIPYNTRCFGTFISRNHAGVYLYLHAALALGLTFWHVRRAGDDALRGGPHLVAAFLAFALALIVALTNSVAGTVAAITLLILAPAWAYFFGFPGSRGSRRQILFVTGGAILFASALVLLTADLGSLGDRFTAKAANFEATKQDDRAPLRRATWALATEGGWAGRVWVGYGAGSFRWISPPYQAQQKELQKDGRLYFRAIHAHNDWLEMLADWGIVGLLPVLAALAWLGRRLVRALHPGHPETYPLAAGLILFGLHATIDLLFWFTPLMFTAAFILAALTIWTDQSSAETARDAS
jgi:O-antigen ligase